MTFDFHGADFIFTRPLYYGLILGPQARHVQLQNFTVDYQPLPFTQVRVVSVDAAASRVTYSVEPGWQHPSTFNTVSVPPGQPFSLEVQVFRNGRPASGTRRMLSQLPLTGNTFPLTSFTAPATVSAIRPGDVVVLSMRGGSDAINLNHCNDCTVRNVTVYACGCGGAAVGAISAQGNLMERVYTIPKPGTDRLVSTLSAVAIGIGGPNNRIRLSRAIRTMDDGLWFYGRVAGTAQSQPGLRSLVIAATTAWTAMNFGDVVPNGSPVTFQRLSDGVIVGSAVMLSQTPPSQSPLQFTATFDRDLPATVLGAVMYSTDAAFNGAGSSIERSTVQDQSACCGGVYVTGSANTTVSGNYINRTAFHGVFGVQAMTAGSPPVPPLVNFAVSNNVIDGTNTTSDWWWFQMGGVQTQTLTPGFTLMAGSPFSNIGVANNFIADAGRSAVWLGNANSGSISGNYLLGPNARPDLANANPAKLADAVQPLVIDTTSSDISTANNTVDQTSRRLIVTDTQGRELAAYVPGSTMRLSAHALGSLAGPTVTLTDADGTARPMTVQGSSAHALDVLVPVATGLGGAVVTLTSGSARSFGTLFVDSQDDVPAVNGCTFRADVSSPLVASVASTVPILVVTQPGCSYQVVSTSAFVTAGGGGTGTGVLTVGVAANGGAARVGIVEIAGQPVEIRQAAASDPTAPTGLAVVVAATTVQLTWNPPPQGTPTSYVIEAGSTPGASNLAVVDTGSPATSLTAPVPPGTYFVRARARRGGFTGGASNEVIVDVTGACSAPGIPAALIHAVSGAAVQLAWQPAANATSYLLEAGSSAGLSDLLAINVGNVTAFGATAAPGTYFVRMRGVNPCATSAPSNEAVVVVAGCTPTIAPASLTATAANGVVSLSWGAVAGASGYVLEAGFSVGASNAAVFNVGGTAIAGAAPAGRYYVRVRARTACGLGPATGDIILDVP